MPYRSDQTNFNPLRPCGRRPSVVLNSNAWRRFQSTPPVWAETPYNTVARLREKISIHSARVGGDLKQVPQERQTDLISIHSARVGGDLGEQVRKLRVEISIHSARVGGDHHFQIIYSIIMISIHSARVGGDKTGISVYMPCLGISIHSARVGGDPICSTSALLRLISIHSARVGGDT